MTESTAPKFLDFPVGQQNLCLPWFLKLENWNRNHYGIKMSLGDRDYLHSLCLADDVLLFAKTRLQLERMLADVAEAAAAKGLQVHPDKSKMLTNAWITSPRRVPTHLHAATFHRVCQASWQKSFLQRPA